MATFRTLAAAALPALLLACGGGVPGGAASSANPWNAPVDPSGVPADTTGGTLAGGTSGVFGPAPGGSLPDDVGPGSPPPPEPLPLYPQCIFFCSFGFDPACGAVLQDCLSVCGIHLTACQAQIDSLLTCVSASYAPTTCQATASQACRAELAAVQACFGPT